MRMWMVKPSGMCNQHLLGEHCELHMFIGTLKKKIRIDGYIKNNLFEPKSIESRHQELVDEMKQRGMDHKSPLCDFSYSYIGEEKINHKIDRIAAYETLISRCPRCKEKMGYNC
jgi:hypothetical protein